MLGELLAGVVVFFLIAPSMAKLISPAIHKARHASDIPDLIPITIVSLVLFFAWLAHAMGVPALLGGFAAGLSLSRFFFCPSTLP